MQNAFHILISTVAGILVVLAVMGGPDTATASHLKVAGAHIGSIHDSSVAENWCADTNYSTMSLADARTVISASYTGGGSQDWNGLASNKVDLSQYTTAQCFANSNWQSDYKLINQVVSDYWAGVYCSGYSCQYALYNWSCAGGGCHWGNSHQMLKQSTMQSFPIQIHVVNHETGHAFGFDDPPPSYCSPTSVMHSAVYGCTDYYWPTSTDRNVLTYFVQDPSY